MAPAATTPTQTTPTDSDHQQYFAGILEKNPESIQIVSAVRMWYCTELYAQVLCNTDD